MANVTVYSWDKKKVGEVELDDQVFAQEVRKDLLHTVVKWQLAKRRQGTHCTKTRGEVVGSSKKPFKQKGTGNARQGSKKAPIQRTGGIVFGPKPRSYEYNLPKKVKKLAMKSALSYLVKEGRFFVVDDMNSETGKTKELAQRLSKFGVQKAVLMDVDTNSMFERASRNVKSFLYYSTEGMNVYDLLKYDNAIVTKSALEKIVARC